MEESRKLEFMGLLERSELEMVEGERERQGNYKEAESLHCFSL